MRVTKYPQSCLLVEESAGGRLLIDVGTFTTEDYGLADFGEVDAVLFTHRHPDHFDRRWAEQALGEGIPVYANADVCAQLDAAEGTTTLADGESATVAGFDVTAHDRPHVPLVDGSAGPPNTGFVLDDRLYHPGDSLTVDGIGVDVLAAPIVGPSISFRDAYVMLEETGASSAVPIHYDFFVADPDLFEHFCDVATVHVLDHGESVEV